jgi:hypothetical protein
MKLRIHVVLMEILLMGMVSLEALKTPVERDSTESNTCTQNPLSIDI